MHNLLYSITTKVDIELKLICMDDLLLYVQVNSYGHVGKFFYPTLRCYDNAECALKYNRQNKQLRLIFTDALPKPLFSGGGSDLLGS